MREMMKKIIYIIYVAVTITAMTSCRGGDDFTESIFDTSIPVLDEK